MTVPGTTSAGSASFSRPLALLVAGTFFMEILDGTIIATAAPGIAADLNVRAVDINLAMTAYLITLAVGIPISGWLAERFGARRVFTTAIAIFTLASLVCALSPNRAFLCGARMLQGNCLPDVAADHCPVLAPVLGGLLVAYASWHWIFLTNIPLGIVAFLVALKLVPQLRASRGPPSCSGCLWLQRQELRLSSGSKAPATPCWICGHWASPLFLVGNAGGSAYRLIISAVPCRSCCR